MTADWANRPRHVHGDPGAECTYEQTWHRPCPFRGARFWPGWACLSCGQRVPEHLDGCRYAVGTVTAVESPNAPRPDSHLVRELADMIRRIEYNYDLEGSGPGSRFEGRLREDVQAQAIVDRLFGRLGGGPCTAAVECLRTLATARLEMEVDGG